MIKTINDIKLYPKLMNAEDEIYAVIEDGDGTKDDLMNGRKDLKHIANQMQGNTFCTSILKQASLNYLKYGHKESHDDFDELDTAFNDIRQILSDLDSAKSNDGLTTLNVSNTAFWNVSDASDMADSYGAWTKLYKPFAEKLQSIENNFYNHHSQKAIKMINQILGGLTWNLI